MKSAMGLTASLLLLSVFIPDTAVAQGQRVFGNMAGGGAQGGNQNGRMGGGQGGNQFGGGMGAQGGNQFGGGMGGQGVGLGGGAPGDWTAGLDAAAIQGLIASGRRAGRKPRKR